VTDVHDESTFGGQHETAKHRVREASKTEWTPRIGGTVPPDVGVWSTVCRIRRITEAQISAVPDSGLYPLFGGAYIYLGQGTASRAR